MPARLELNMSRWPVVEITNPMSFTDEEWTALMSQVEQVVQRDVPFAMINDVRQGPPPSAKQRKAIANLYREHVELVKRNWMGTAVITSSSLVKGAITALNWLMPPPHPVKVHSNYEDGERWAFEQLGLSTAWPPRRK